MARLIQRGEELFAGKVVLAEEVVQANAVIAQMTAATTCATKIGKERDACRDNEIEALTAQLVDSGEQITKIEAKLAVAIKNTETQVLTLQP